MVYLTIGVVVRGATPRLGPGDPAKSPAAPSWSSYSTAPLGARSGPARGRVARPLSAAQRCSAHSSREPRGPHDLGERKSLCQQCGQLADIFSAGAATAGSHAPAASRGRLAVVVAGPGSRAAVPRTALRGRALRKRLRQAMRWARTGPACPPTAGPIGAALANARNRHAAGCCPSVRALILWRRAEWVRYLCRTPQKSTGARGGSWRL